LGDHGSSQNQQWRLHGFQALQRELLGSDAATPPRRQAEAEKGGTNPNLFFYGGYSNSWIDYNRKSEHKMDDDWGNPGLNRTNMDDFGGSPFWEISIEKTVA